MAQIFLKSWPVYPVRFAILELEVEKWRWPSGLAPFLFAAKSNNHQGH
jgi:hypothetical protein